MTAILRTNYANVNIGSNDPLWIAGGVHTKAADRATIQLDPVNNQKALKLTVKPGDVVFTAGRDRAEVMHGQIGGTEGDRIQVAFKLLLPTGFNSPNGSASLFDFHVPNTGVAQSPITMWCNNGGTLNLRLWGGPEGGDHTSGSVRLDRDLITLQKNRWYAMVVDAVLSSNASLGYFAFYVDGVALISQSFPVLVAGSRNIPIYWKQGHYRTASTYDATYWFGDTFFFKNPNPNEALAAVGGTPIPDPDPVPDPTPDVPVDGYSSIQSAETVNPGQQWTVETESACDKVIFQVNSLTPVEVTNSTANVFATTIPANVPIGAGTLTFTTVNGTATKKVGPYGVVFATPDSLPLTLVSQTSTTYTVSWIPPANAAGYHFFVDGTRVSSSTNGAQASTTFTKLATAGLHTYEVKEVIYDKSGKLIK